MHLYKNQQNVGYGLLASVFLLLSGMSSSNAAAIVTPITDNSVPWVFSVSGGIGWSEAGKRESFNLTPSIPKSYDAKKTNTTLGMFELFAGLQKDMTPTLQGQLGLSLGFVNNASFAGDIWDDGLPQFSNHNYQYKVKQTHVSLKGKLIFDKGWFVLPWVGARVGIGFNTAHKYSNQPKLNQALPNENFTSHTCQSFTYALSAGMQKQLNNNWQVGLAYEFADLGKSQLGRAPSQTLNNGITQNHLYTNNILLNVTYMA